MKILNFTLSRIHAFIGISVIMAGPLIVLGKDFKKDYKNAKIVSL